MGQEVGPHDLGTGTFCLALTLGILARAGLSKLIKLPYTVILMLFGLLIGGLVGMGHHEGMDAGIFEKSVDIWTNITPDAILFTILPILIFETSFSSDLHLFMKQIVPVLTLAVPVVVFNTVLIGLVSKYMFPYGWDITMSFAFGAMLAATDPVAVVALLKDLGVAESLSVLIEGESLLNDGTAIVVYSIFMSPIVNDQTLSTKEVLEHAFTLCVGGPVIGVIVGAIGSWVLGVILNDPLSEITVTVVCCFGSYTLAESTGIHASGVLSMVFAGLYLSFYGLGRISARVTHSLHSFWQMAGYITNTLIFFISGLIMAEKALFSSNVHTEDWGYLMVLYISLNIIRGLSVILAYPVLNRGPYGINWRQALILWYGGLRGAVGLTLALAIHQQKAIALEDRDRILFLMAGSVLLTVLINGTTTKLLLRALGLDRASTAEIEMFVRTSSLIEFQLEEAVRELQRDEYLGDAAWPVVWRYIPVPTPQVYWHRIQKGNVRLNHEEEEIITEYVRNPSKGRRKWCPVLWRRRYRFEHLPPRLRGRWRRYIREYNTVQPGWPDYERLEASRHAVYEAIQNHVSLAHDMDERYREFLQKCDEQCTPLTPVYGVLDDGHCSYRNLDAAHHLSGIPDFEPFNDTDGSSDCESIPEARMRILSILKHAYWGFFQVGLLSPHGLRTFERNMAILVTDTSGELHQWDTLEKYLLVHLRAMSPVQRWRHLPIVGHFIDSYLAHRLAFVFEMALVFIKAHEALKVGTLFGQSSISQKLALEVALEIRSAKETLHEFLPVFPDIFASVKTEMACRFLLHRYRSLLEDNFEAGATTSREHERCIRKCDNSMVKLYDHSHSEQAPPRISVLSSAGFLRFVTTAQFDALFSEKAKRSDLCKDIFLRAHKPLLPKEAASGASKGWYVVVRGSVVVGENDDSDGDVMGIGATIGLVECLLGTRMQAECITASFTHLLYFDKAAVMAEAEKCPALLHSLWWYVALVELRKTADYGAMPLPQLSTLLSQCQYLAIPKAKPQKYRPGATIRLLQRVDFSYGSTDETAVETQRKISAGGDVNLLLLQGGIEPCSKNAKGEPPEESLSYVRSTSDGLDLDREPSLASGPSVSVPLTSESELGDDFLHLPSLLRRLEGTYRLARGSVCFILPILPPRRPSVASAPSPLPPPMEVVNEGEEEEDDEHKKAVVKEVDVEVGMDHRKSARGLGKLFIPVQMPLEDDNQSEHSV